MNQYICDDDDLGCLHDYLIAAINGDDISELPRLWNQEMGVIRSRPFQNQRAMVLDEAITFMQSKIRLPSNSGEQLSYEADIRFAVIRELKELRQKAGEP